MDTGNSNASELIAQPISMASEGRLNAVYREVRLVLPVVGVWFLVWLPLWYFELTGGYSELRSYLMSTVCSVGVACTVLWCCLYGEFGLRRVTAGLLLLVLTTSFAMVVGKLFHSLGNFGFASQITLGIFFVGLLGFVPGWCLRRFLRWRICRFSELSFTHDRRFKIAEIFLWTTGAAVLLALLPIFSELLFSETPSNFLAFFVAMTIVIPSLATFCYFTLLSKVHARYLVFAIPLLAASLSMCVAVLVWGAAINGPTTLGNAVEEAFWQTTICFSLAGYFLLAAATYLRTQGLYFKVGLVDHRSCARRAKAKYEEHLQERIRTSAATAEQSRLELEELSLLSVDALA